MHNKQGMFHALIIQIIVALMGALFFMGSLQASEEIFQKGVRAYDEKQFVEAERFFEEALQGDATLKSRVILYRGLIALHRNRFDEGAEFFIQLDRSGLTQEELRHLSIGLDFLYQYGEGVLDRTQERFHTVLEPWKVPPRKPWRVELGLVGEYVEGIVLGQFKDLFFVPVRQDKFRGRASAFGEYTWLLTPKATLSLRYRGEQFQYENTRRDLDVQVHRAGVQSNVALNREQVLNFYADTSVYYMGQSFDRTLNSTRGGASFNFREWGPLYGSVGVEAADDNFHNDDQDNLNQTVGLFQVLRFKRASDYISLGYTYQNARANKNMFSYQQSTVGLGGGMGLFKNSIVSLHTAFSNANFDGRDLVQMLQNRKDDVTSAVFRYTYKFPKNFDLYAQYYYSNHHSNILRQDYLTKMTSVGVDYRF